MNSTDQAGRPPYIRFERRALEDRTVRLPNGAYGMKDVDFIIAQRPGSRDTVERPVADFITDWNKRAQDGALPYTWVQDLEKGYQFWLKNEEPPVSGTPIKGWPLLSPAQQRVILNAGIRSVEDLAQLPDSELGVIGVGAQDMKQRAKSWIAAASDGGKLAAENAELRSQLATANEAIARLETGFKELRGAQVAKALEKVEK